MFWVFTGLDMGVHPIVWWNSLQNKNYSLEAKKHLIHILWMIEWFEPNGLSEDFFEIETKSLLLAIDKCRKDYSPEMISFMLQKIKQGGHQNHRFVSMEGVERSNSRKILYEEYLAGRSGSEWKKEFTLELFDELLKLYLETRVNIYGIYTWNLQILQDLLALTNFELFKKNITIKVMEQAFSWDPSAVWPRMRDIKKT
jgi:hypothetical protein